MISLVTINLVDQGLAFFKLLPFTFLVWLYKDREMESILAGY